MSSDVEPAFCQWLRSYFSGRICFIWFVNDIAQICEYVRVFFYADDMKLFLPVRDYQDCLKRQSEQAG
jgi:hypothetical protein